MSDLLVAKDYAEIRKRLYAEDPAIQFLAFVSLERLERKDLIDQTMGEHYRNLEILNSPDSISFCMGCTIWETMPLKEIFSHRGEYPDLYRAAQRWADRHLEGSQRDRH